MTRADLVGKVLQDDQNFHLEIVDWQGKLAVKKTAKATTPASRVERMLNDVDGMRFFSEMADKRPEFRLYVPAIYEEGDRYYIREYIDCPVVADAGMSFAEAAPRVKQLAKLLADIDQLEPHGPAGYIGSSNYQNLHGSIGRWVSENLAENLINQTQADRAMEISKGLGRYIKPRIAHGDMSAYKHAYICGDKIALIDFENFSSQAARYYDVAWCYTRMFGLGSPELARHFLAEFLKVAAKPTHQAEQLMAVVIQRTVGLQKDADVDAQRGTDYRDRASELLELVLQNKLELLHG
ncbi:hypothetical protein HY380_00885 [Candidatus Saccharibacteria bacterium]|nr:hypothetical protein [Candidatus Saccharibacteria bacterium]